MLHLELVWIDWLQVLMVLQDGGDANFSCIREVFVGILDGFSRKSEGHSPNMDLRRDSS